MDLGEVMRPTEFAADLLFDLSIKVLSGTIAIAVNAVELIRWARESGIFFRD